MVGIKLGPEKEASLVVLNPTGLIWKCGFKDLHYWRAKRDTWLKTVIVNGVPVR